MVLRRRIPIWQLHDDRRHRGIGPRFRSTPRRPGSESTRFANRRLRDSLWTRLSTKPPERRESETVDAVPRSNPRVRSEPRSRPSEKRESHTNHDPRKSTPILPESETPAAHVTSPPRQLHVPLYVTGTRQWLPECGGVRIALSYIEESEVVFRIVYADHRASTLHTLARGANGSSRWRWGRGHGSVARPSRTSRVTATDERFARNRGVACHRETPGLHAGRPAPEGDRMAPPAQIQIGREPSRDRTA